MSIINGLLLNLTEPVRKNHNTCTHPEFLSDPHPSFLHDAITLTTITHYMTLQSVAIYISTDDANISNESPVYVSKHTAIHYEHKHSQQAQNLPTKLKISDSEFLGIIV